VSDKKEEEKEERDIKAGMIFGFVLFALFGSLFDQIVLWSIRADVSFIIFLTPFIGAFVGLILERHLALAFLIGVFVYPILIFGDTGIASALTIDVGIGMLGGFLAKFFHSLILQELERQKAEEELKNPPKKEENEQEEKDKIILP